MDRKKNLRKNKNKNSNEKKKIKMIYRNKNTNEVHSDFNSVKNCLQNHSCHLVSRLFYLNCFLSLPLISKSFHVNSFK